MAQKFFAYLTTRGEAKLAQATALGIQLKLTQMGVGDGGGTLPTPSPSQTKLVNERRRAGLNSLTVDPQNSSQIIAEQVIPENEGGWWIREIGLYDDAGELIAVANCAETYKPLLVEGSGRTQVIRMVLIVSSTEAVTLKIDPSVILATRQYVDTAINDTVIQVQLYTDNQIKYHLWALDPHPQYAPKESPVLTGKPRSPTPAPAENSDIIATTAYVRAAIAALIASSPAALDTLNEIAAALGNDPSFSRTMLNALAAKQPLDSTLTALAGKSAAGLVSFLGFGEGTNWLKMPGGLIIQRGSIGFNPGLTEINITLPRAFTNNNYAVSLTWSDRNNDGSAVKIDPASVAVIATTKSVTGFRAFQAGTGGYNVDFIAMGY